LYQDNTNNVTAYYWTKDFYLKDAKGNVIPFNKKRILVLRLYVYATSSTTMTIRYSVDEGTTYSEAPSITLTTTPTVYEIPMDFIGNRVRFGFYGEYNAQFKIKGFSIHYLDLGVAR
jgi:hypothetical protein